VAAVNALANAGIELGENGSVIPRPKALALHTNLYTENKNSQQSLGNQ
jgi:hypothetical protein